MIRDLSHVCRTQNLSPAMMPKCTGILSIRQSGFRAEVAVDPRRTARRFQFAKRVPSILDSIHSTTHSAAHSAHSASTWHSRATRLVHCPRKEGHACDYAARQADYQAARIKFRGVNDVIRRERHIDISSKRWLN